MKKYLIGFVVFTVIMFTLYTQRGNDSSYTELMEEGYNLMLADNPDEAVVLFKQAYSLHNDDTALNNMSWAYNELEEYELSKEYILKALKTGPSDAIELANAGMAYSGLGDYEQSIEFYKRSIEINPYDNISYTGLGYCYLALDNYAESIFFFEKAIEFDDSYDIYLGLLDALYLSKSLDDLIIYAEKAVELYPDKYELYDYFGEALSVTSTENEMISFYKTLEEKFPNEEGIHLNLAWYYFNQTEYYKSIDILNQLIDNYSDFATINLLTHALMNNQQYDLANEQADRMIKLYGDNYISYNNKGLILNSQGYTLEATPYYLEAASLTDEIDPYVNVLESFYYAKRYSKVIEYALEIQEKIGNTLYVSEYLAYASLEKLEYEEAVKHFNNMLKYDEVPDYVHYDLAECFYRMNDDYAALLSLERYLSLYPSDTDALYLKEMISYKEEKSDKLLNKLFSEYYLYEYDLINVQTSIIDLSDKQISKLMDQIKSVDDPFTYIVSGDNYSQTLEPIKSLDIVALSDTVTYVQIPIFDATVDNLFIELIDTINNTEEQTLIIDLRQNLGGYTESANNILDVLLPEVVTSQIILKDGSNYAYYSDLSMVRFKDIYILVDEYTASAAELMTLGLSTYLDNVTVVGQQTYGKGVGQKVYDDPVNERLYFVVNHYWNVRQQNIDGVGITPDIVLEQVEVAHYIENLVDGELE